MNKSALVLLTICLIAGAFAVPESSCIFDTQLAIHQANQFISHIKSMTVHQRDLYEEGTNLLNELSEISSECGFISNDASANTCLQNVESYIPTLTAIVNAIEESNFDFLETDGLSLLNQIDDVNSSCNYSLSETPMLSSSSFFSCASASFKFFNAVTTLQKDIITVQITNAVMGAYKIIYSLQPLLNDCGIDIKLNIPKIYLPNFRICDVKIGPLASLISNIQNNFKRGNFDKIFDDVKNVVGFINQLTSSCKSNQMLASPIFDNFLQCFMLTNQLSKQVNSIKNDYSQKEYPQMIVSSYNVIKGVQNLLNACLGYPIDLNIPEISQENLQECVSNASDILQNLKAIKNDIANKNYFNLFADAEQIIGSLNDAQIECSYFSNN